MSDNADYAHVLQRLAFYGLAVISYECATSQICVLLAAAKPDEKRISALKQSCALNDIIAILSFNNACRKRDECL
ncbi:hypothetical protein RVY14_000697 [Enterobacter cloacae]|nr:hypothetical protein [Enterobacter cloacae]